MKKYDYWVCLLNAIMDEHLPVKKLNFRTGDLPYVTTGWKNTIKSKRNSPKGSARIENRKIWNLRKGGGMHEASKQAEM